MSVNNTKIITVCGPTASGKSRLAVDIAEKFGGEVINADSMQIYRGMDIAVAMPSEAEKKGIAHHLFGIVGQDKAFSVAEWLAAARGKIAELAERSVLPVVVGGTGLYISSLVDNVIFDDIGEHPDFRAEMYRLAEVHGNAFLLEKLRRADPPAASRLHENNVKRIVRALETYEFSGISAEERLARSRAQSPIYAACMLGLGFEQRQSLYERIDNRADSMVGAGLADEARRCAAGKTASQAIGHKELSPYFKGEASLEECIENLKRKTRNYAKRQLTWFRKDERVNWLLMGEDCGYDGVFAKACGIVANFLTA